MKIKIEFESKKESKPIKEAIMDFLKRIKDIRIRTDEKKNIILDI